MSLVAILEILIASGSSAASMGVVSVTYDVKKVGKLVKCKMTYWIWHKLLF